MATITFENVSKKFGSNEVLKNLSLVVQDGECFTLLGPSGCGKTTVLRLLAGLEELDEGHIILDGEDITNVPAEKRHINTVFQSYALFPHMTIFDNVAFGLRMQKVAESEIKPRVLDALRMVQLEEMADRKPAQLSGGQQQRLCIARAIAVKPQILLMDEPAASLDPVATMQLEETMFELKENYSIIIVTHNMQQAARASDYTAFFYLGDLIEYDETKKIFQDAALQSTSDYVSGRFG